MRMDTRVGDTCGPGLQSASAKTSTRSAARTDAFTCDRFLSRPMKPYHSQFYDKNPISGWHAGGEREIRGEAGRRDQQLSKQAPPRPQQAERSTTEWRGRLKTRPAQMLRHRGTRRRP